MAKRISGMPPRLRSYCGQLRIEDDEFEVVAERFIPRDEGVSFRLVGSDNIGGFVAEGFARKVGDLYVAGSVPLRYSHYAAGDDHATIDFTAVKEMTRQTECHVLGVWVQTGETWTFKGVLRPFDPKHPLDDSVQRRPAPAYTPTKREMKTIRSRVDRETSGAAQVRRDKTLAKYAKKSQRKMKKGNNSKAKQRDMFTKGTRVPGSAFSRK